MPALRLPVGGRNLCLLTTVLKSMPALRLPGGGINLSLSSTVLKSIPVLRLPRGGTNLSWSSIVSELMPALEGRNLSFWSSTELKFISAKRLPMGGLNSSWATILWKLSLPYNLISKKEKTIVKRQNWHLARIPIIGVFLLIWTLKMNGNNILAQAT